MNNPGSNDATDISQSHDYVLTYLKSRTYSDSGKKQAVLQRLGRDEELNKPYKNLDDDPRGRWKAGDYLCNKSYTERPNLYYAVTNPNTGEEVWPKKTAVWRYT